MISRRSLFGGAAALVAAPAIVRISALMPVSALRRRPCPGCGSPYGHSITCSEMMRVRLLQAERIVNPPVIIIGDEVLNAFNRMVIGRIPFVDMSAPPVEFRFASTTNS